MRDVLVAIPGVNSWGDVLLKVMPQIEQEIERKQKELLDLQQRAGKEAEQEAEQQEVERQKPGSPREGANTRGMDSPESDTNPADQPGSELPSIPITRSWFSENFGMTSDEVVDIFVKAERQDLIETITPLIHAERMAVLSSFVGVDPALVKSLPLTDEDYRALNQHKERFDISFRRFVKAWTSADDEGKADAYDDWRGRVSKSERLSVRERNIMEQSYALLKEQGMMDARAIVSRGIPASSSEISSLFKSHGFLFGIEVVGRGSKSTDRASYYDLADRGDAVIKNAGELLAGLWEVGGKVEADSRGTPRLILPFSSDNAATYAECLKSEMGVRSVRAEGAALVIEGEAAVSKAAEEAVPWLSQQNRFLALVTKAAIEGDDRAIRLFSYETCSPEKRVKLLKRWKIDEDGLRAGFEEALKNGEASD